MFMALHTGNKHNKPIHRSKIRLLLGRQYFTLKRHLLWISGNYKFAKQSPDIHLQYNCITHQTPLIRQLKDVDMYLQYNKINNLNLAVCKLNYLLVKPGETFSYWKSIGNTTRRKGYLDGIVLCNGTFKPGVGGGLCQLSNLIYWMTLHTPLTVIERYRHGYDVFPDSNRTQPFGSGATCSYNYMDLMIRNDTTQTFQLCLEVSETHLIGCWKSDRPMQYHYEVYEKDHRIDCEYWGGYSRHNTLYRKAFDENGSLIDDEFITENHALMMYQPYLSKK